MNMCRLPGLELGFLWERTFKVIGTQTYIRQAQFTSGSFHVRDSRIIDSILQGRLCVAVDCIIFTIHRWLVYTCKGKEYDT